MYSQRDKLTLPPLFFQIFSNCECYLDKDRSSPILIFCLKIFAKKNHQKRLEMKPIQVTSVINVLLPEEISLATCCYRLSSSKKRDCYFAFEFLFCHHYSKREKQENVVIIICCNKRNALIGSAIFHVDYRLISYVLS